MEAYYFRQINLPFSRKAALMHALLRFIAAQPGAVPRNAGFNKRFIEEYLKAQFDADPWLSENVDRLFWVCCQLSLLQYQYPYPHREQTYLPTRIGKFLARAPRLLTAAFVTFAYALALVADPVKKFNRVRNTVTVASTLLLWWHHHELSANIVAFSIAVGIISSWIASFFTGLAD